MTTAPLRKEASRDQDEILALFDALRQAHHDKNASAIAAAYADDASSAICRRRCFIAASMPRRSRPGSTAGKGRSISNRATTR